MTAGKFITFEGGDGAGKTTQMRILAETLADRGIEVVRTREPGGSPQAELLRDLLISGDVDRWSARAETLLNYAARDHHLTATIMPALARGDWVLCDRFADSTRAYQGAAGGVSLDMIDAIHREVVGRTEPDLTLIMDVPAETGLARARGRGDAGRFENMGPAFHGKLRESFLDIARACPERCVLIDASGDVEKVSRAILNAVETRLPTA